jgi:hypothetical protein
MLRTLIVALVLANLVFFAWTQGWIDGPTGIRAHGDREPERLGLQVQPELVQILSAQAAKAASAPASAPPPAAPASIPAAPAPLACLEAGPFSGAEAAAAEAAVRAALPEGSWISIKSGRPGLWMVYMGKFKDRDEQLKKQEELRAMRVEYDDLRSPPELLPGLSLGRFEERANAVNALEKFSLRGIRTAKVIEVRTPASAVLLRVDKATPALAAQVSGLTSAALGKGFAPCTRAAGN